MFTTIMPTHTQRFTICYWLSGAIAILLLIATVGGLFLPGLYRDTPYNAVQAQGQDLVSLVIGLPLLVGGLLFTMRGSERALLVWLGALTYILYTYLTFAFGSVFNEFFLLYVALVSLSFFTLVIALLHLDAGVLHLHFGRQVPVKTVSLFLLAVACLFFLSWMKQILPALVSGQLPASITLARTPSNPIFVLDLALLLPAICFAAVWLWRRQAWGYVLCGIFLVKVWTLTLAILSMSWFMYASNQQGLDPVFVTVLVVLAVTSLVLAVIYLENLHKRGQKVLEAIVP